MANSMHLMWCACAHSVSLHPNSIHFLDISLRSKLFPIVHLERPKKVDQGLADAVDLE
jgi:hypothetical protein